MTIETHVGVKRYMKTTAWAGVSSGTLSTPTDEYDRNDLWQYYSNGTGNYQCNVGTHVYRSLAPSQTRSQDLYNTSTVSAFWTNFGQKVRFTAVKWFYVKNHSATYSMNIFLDAPATGVWTSLITPLGAAGFELEPQAEFYASKPVDGFPVSGTNRWFSVSNISSTRSIAYEIAIAGLGTLM